VKINAGETGLSFRTATHFTTRIIIMEDVKNSESPCAGIYGGKVSEAERRTAS
jgi:hypothetical protein